MFSDHFDALISKITFLIKKYFDLFPNKNTLKNNRNHTSEHN